MAGREMSEEMMKELCDDKDIVTSVEKWMHSRHDLDTEELCREITQHMADIR